MDNFFHKIQANNLDLAEPSFMSKFRARRRKTNKKETFAACAWNYRRQALEIQNSRLPHLSQGKAAARKRFKWVITGELQDKDISLATGLFLPGIFFL